MTYQLISKLVHLGVRIEIFPLVDAEEFTVGIYQETPRPRSGDYAWVTGEVITSQRDLEHALERFITIVEASTAVEDEDA